MRVEYNINKVHDTSYPLAQYGLLDVHSPMAPGLTSSKIYNEPWNVDFSQKIKNVFKQTQLAKYEDYVLLYI
jgi:hypothetical protein